MEDPNPSHKTTTTNLINAYNITSSSNLDLDSDDNNNNPLGYQLRALNENISAFDSNPWLDAPTTPQHSINASHLSPELVNETLNYFVNCGTRLSQMTKTYDDNGAYLLLLQEKEVDLELAARIGQDLLKQNNDLKDSIKNLESELAKRQDDVQQLKYELASKTSLLDTFIEEEQHQTSLAYHFDEESTLRLDDQKPGTSSSIHHGTTTTNNNNNNNINSTITNSSNNKNASTTPSNKYLAQKTDYNNYDLDEEGGNYGFLSLNNYTNQRMASASQAEPFSSLPYYLSSTVGGTAAGFLQHLNRDDSSSSISEELNSKGESPNNQNTTTVSEQQSGLVQSVTIQLVESNKRLCELQDELFYKSEQNLLQQEKIYKLQEQIKESDRRLGDIASENQTLQKSMEETLEMQKELSDELKVSKRNFNELLDVFLELQKETKLYRSMQENSKSSFFNIGMDPMQDHQAYLNNVSFDSFTTNDTTIPDPYNNNPNTTSTCEACNHCNTNNIDRIQHNTSNNTARRPKQANRVPISSLLEELQESMQKEENDEFLDATCCLIGSRQRTGGGCKDNSSDDGDVTDGADSGVHSTSNKTSSSCRSGIGKAHSYNTGSSNNISSTTITPSPTSGGLTTDTEDDSDQATAANALVKVAAGVADDDDDEEEGESDDSGKDKRNWIGLSSFVLTTLILICLSATFNRSSSSPNFNLANRLRIKLDR